MKIRCALFALVLASPFSSSSGMPEQDTCGPDADKQCVAQMELRNSALLQTCLETSANIDWDKKVTVLEYLGSASAVEVSKLTFPQKNLAEYEAARFSAGAGIPRWPAGILYAEDETEVVAAVDCARAAGYNVSPRGRGHSFQGLSNMDGYLVIDLSQMCKPEEFELTPRNGTWLLGEDQKILGSIKAGAGCTNAVMLAYTANQTEFEDGGIYLIGSCPSVGITGEYKRACFWNLSC